MSLLTKASRYDLSEAQPWIRGGKHVDTDRCTDCVIEKEFHIKILQ
jgi:hypothetical protein